MILARISTLEIVLMISITAIVIAYLIYRIIKKVRKKDNAKKGKDQEEE